MGRYIIKLVEFTISNVKGNEFKFDSDVKLSYILNLIVCQLITFFRGVIKVRKKVFIGENVKIRAAYKLRFGKSVVIGNNVNIDALSNEGICLGNNVKVGSNSFLIASGSVRDLGIGIVINDNSAIGEFSYIGGAGGVNIGNDTIVGQYFSVHPENHNYEKTDELIRFQGVNRNGVRIGSNCWIGSKVSFLDGSEVGDGCVVAAGSVVTKKFGGNLVIGGVPAKILKNR